MAVLVDRTVMPWLPPVSFNDRPEFQVMPTAEETKAKGLDKPDIRLVQPSDYPYEVRHESRLLTLPLELRLAIYYWVYLQTPVHHAQLAPWYPVPYQKEYVSRVVGEGKVEEREARIDCETSTHRTKLLSSSRPLCGIPTSLLRANREIYHEARTIPFVYNEFVFVNWFSSGVWAARSFTRPLRSWQLSSLRYFRLELLTRDLMGSGSRELSHVCNALSDGLQGLRLKIVPGGLSLGQAWLKDRSVSWTGDVSEDIIGWGWVEDGIAKLRNLERLEIEVQVPSWGNEEKSAWCERLQEVLRRNGLETEVVCVEGVEESKEVKVEKLLEEMTVW